MVTMDGSLVCFEPAGELSIYQVEEVHKRLKEQWPAMQSVRIDLTHTDKIDTAGFQLLVSILKSAQSASKEVACEGYGGSVENFMDLFGFDRVCGGES